MKLFLDVNVVLDVLAAREPWLADAAALLSAVERGKAEGVIAAHTVTTLHYLLGRHGGRDLASTALVRLSALVDVAPVTGEVLMQALALDVPDFEDAVQAVCALRCGARLVTRDPGGFRSAGVTLASPKEALALLEV